MANNAGSAEPVKINAADFVGLPVLFDQWAMASGAVDRATVARDVLQSISRLEIGGLYVLQGSRPVPIRVRWDAWVEGLEVLDTEDGEPLKFPPVDHDKLLAALYRAYVGERLSPDSFMRGGNCLFRLGAVGIDRADAANVLAAAKDADLSPVPTNPVLTLVPTASTKQALPAGVVQPVGGTWPHQLGAWTDAEREAMFKMRHLSKMTGAAIAQVTGCSRQCIDEQIGPAKLVNGWAAKSGWCPSTAVLTACKLPLQPLQALAQVGGRR
ncbi:hypothetical protein HNP55_001002 [Paucibacter oligotrophus]|uniref:Uncharacterized protein n=1 Tax=Roseateles oligotrophus TaxID=1769250 RepID=A0A840LAV0_9BURK|nr:hypothetical protein [Roseateles oligotrophus]MBB4842487.1 hypothetical protein [Roseateles oligotrophus]